MTRKERIKEILQRLDRQYGADLHCYLEFDEDPWRLLVATQLSAQCTDARVNQVTKTLFVKYPDVQAFADADLAELEQDIHSTGFYHNKAVNLIGCAKKLIADYGGVVPKDIDDLTSLPGVGRKTANVIRGNIFGEPSIVVDTHVKRIANKLGMTDETEPVKVEFDLMKVVPKDHWILINLDLIALGRSICPARNPKCGECFLADVCRDNEKRLKAAKAQPDGEKTKKVLDRSDKR